LKVAYSAAILKLQFWGVNESDYLF
jgi:hypothetical protein